MSGPIKVYTDDPMEEFDVTISYGLQEISLNDGVNFQMGVEGFGNKQQSLRKLESSSRFYDGTYITHYTKENVMETVTVYVLGYSQNHVTENLLLLEELFTQLTFRISVRIDDHMETWSCFPSEYAIDRGHINMHNGRATFTAQVPRLPKVSYEVVL
jgi:hypothetical protein